MSQSVKKLTRLTYNTRIERIKELLPKGTDWNAIATVCGVTRKTIWRDFNRWRKSEDFKAWLYSEYVRLVGEVKGSDPDKALREITRIIIKDMTEKVEQKTETRGELIVDIPTLEGLSETAVAAVVENFMEDEARKLRKEKPGPV